MKGCLTKIGVAILCVIVLIVLGVIYSAINTKEATEVNETQVVDETQYPPKLLSAAVPPRLEGLSPDVCHLVLLDIFSAKQYYLVSYNLKRALDMDDKKSSRDFGRVQGDLRDRLMSLGFPDDHISDIALDAYARYEKDKSNLR